MHGNLVVSDSDINTADGIALGCSLFSNQQKFHPFYLHPSDRISVSQSTGLFPKLVKMAPTNAAAWLSEEKKHPLKQRNHPSASQRPTKS